MSEDVAVRFVATYFRMIYNDIISLPKFYRKNAEIKRVYPTNNSDYVYSSQNGDEIAAFNPNERTTKVYTHHTTILPRGMLINVYGTISGNSQEYLWTQQFVLTQTSGRWFIVADTFYQFPDNCPQLIGAEIETAVLEKHNVQPPIQANKPINTSFQPMPTNIFSQMPQINPKNRSTDIQKRPRLEGFDRNRSLTLLNLSNNYNGEEVSSLFTHYGIISNKFFTHNTIYLELETIEDMESAVNGRPPVYQGAYIRVERGIVQKETRNYGRYNRYNSTK